MGKFVEGPAGLGRLEGLDHVLESSRHEEVLLLETQLLASPVIVVRVENLGDLEGTLARGEGFRVVSLVELANCITDHNQVDDRDGSDSGKPGGGPFQQRLLPHGFVDIV